MTQQEQEKINDMEDLIQETNELEENKQILEEKSNIENDEISKLKDQLARTQADYQNFKFRSERDRKDMIFFAKYDIFKKILPRIDDLERMIKNTPADNQNWALYEWIIAMEKSFKRDLEALWVNPFVSIWQEVNPDRHEVMTQIQSETPWIIVDEFEKWYLLWDRVLRVAKVIVWA